MKKKPAVLPRGYRTCTASLAVSDVPLALRFYEDAFGAKIQAHDPEEAPGFAAIKIGNSMLFVTAGWGAHGAIAPGAVTPVAHHMYLDDVDGTLTAALENGASLIAPAADTYWGERCATVADPFGHVWTLATRLEALKSDEIGARRRAFLAAIETPDAAHDATPDAAPVDDPETSDIA
ncbi:MAG: VOC family protein [Marinibacterium sp.]|nr:VOC family protein [Marinibacterium sp.]